MKKSNITFILLLFIAVVLGKFSGDLVVDVANKPGVELLGIVPFLLSGIVFILLYIFLLNIGSFIFAKMTGYKLSKISFFSYQLYWRKGKFTVVKESVPGLVASCFMYPEEDFKKFSYLSYYLGGIILVVFTMITSMLFFNAYPIMVINFICIGIIFVLGSIIPYKGNVGATISLLRKSKEQKFVLFSVLRTRGLLIEGVRFSEIPKEYLEKFNVKENLFVLSQLMFRLGLAYENRDKEEAEEVLETLWHSRDDLLKMNEIPFKRELLFYLLTYDKEDYRVKELLKDKELQKILSRDTLSNKRVQGTIELVVNNNPEKAKNILKQGLIMHKDTGFTGLDKVERELSTELLSHWS